MTKTKPTTALAKWDEVLSKHAKEAAAITGAPSGNFVSLKGGQIKINKTPVPDNTLDCIVVAHVFENAYYEGEFDADVLAPPVCFALGTKEDELKPHADSENPQHPTCAGCPQNEFNTAERGHGKACKNHRRLALIPEDAIEGDVLGTKTVYLKTPPTSGPVWDGYVRQMNDTLHRPPFALVTSITTAPQEAGGFQLEIKLKSRIEDAKDVDDSVLDALVSKHNAEMKVIEFPYKPLNKEDREALRHPKKGGPSKFKRGGAKTNMPVVQKAKRSTGFSRTR